MVILVARADVPGRRGRALHAARRSRSRLGAFADPDRPDRDPARPRHRRRCSTLIVLTVGFLAMPNVWPMVYVTLAGLLAIPILWETMHDYQKNRILAFIDCSVAIRREQRAGTRSSRSSRSAPARSRARASSRARRTSSTSCPSTGPTSRTRCGPRSGASSARCSCSRSSLPARVDPQRRAVGARSRRRGDLRRRRGDDVLARRRQHRDGARHRAGRRRDAAVHLVRRQLARRRSSSRWASSRTSRCASTATDRGSVVWAWVGGGCDEGRGALPERGSRCRDRRDPTALAHALEASGIHAIAEPRRREDGAWFLTFEVHLPEPTVETTACALLAGIEALTGEAREIWYVATLRQLHFGFEGGAGPRAFTTGSRARRSRALSRPGCRCG